MFQILGDGNEPEPFVVLPMQQVNPNFKVDVDKLYDPDQHPGILNLTKYKRLTNILRYN